MRSAILRVLGMFKGRRRSDAVLDDEIRTHLDLLAGDFVRRGMTVDEARAAARREFGGVDQIKEIYRDQHGIPWLETFLRDLRFGWRSMRRAPALTAVIVLTLGVAIGANTAIFGIVDAVLLKPLGYEGADRLVAIHEVLRDIRMYPQVPVNATHFERWRQSTRSFEDLALLREINVNLTGSGDPERLNAGRVSANLFRMLGVRAQLGRTFFDEEDHAGQDRVVVLSDGFWRRRFAADPDVVGRRITLDDQPFVVVGVLPKDFWFPKLSLLYAIPVTAETPDIWKPFGLTDAERSPEGDYNFACLARLRRGVSPAQAAADLNRVQAALEEGLTYPLGHQAAVVALHRQLTSPSRAGLWMLFVASGVVLVIGCVNVASLLLGRVAARQRELAVRRAIGASRTRLLGQMLTECSLLCGAAAGVGLGIAYAVTRLLAVAAPVDLPRIHDVAIDTRMLLFAVAATMATTFVAGILPALRSSETSAGQLTGAVTPSRRTMRMRSVLVASEICLSTVCLVSAGLLLHSFERLMHVDRGFDVERLSLVDLNLPSLRYTSLPATTTFVRTLLDRLTAAPGVISASVVSQPPLAGVGGNNSVFIDGVSLAPAEQPMVDTRPVDAGYFRTAGIPLERGRIFNDVDGERFVGVISAAAAARIWPGQNPVGRRFQLGEPTRPAIEVVGVVGDVHGISLSEPPSPTVYLPYWQRRFNRNHVTLAVKSATGAASVAGLVRRTVHEIDPELPVPPARAMTDVVDASAASRRFQAEIVTTFAFAALVLVVLGTYGVISYSVTQRTHEIGIRLALGAVRADVAGNVLAGAMKVALAGLAAGVPLAVAAAYLLRSFLFGVMPTDVMAIGGTCAVLVVTALVAALMPAVRASRLDPLIALRGE
jgi:putative ABC transport system permease protein